MPCAPRPLMSPTCSFRFLRAAFTGLICLASANAAAQERDAGLDASLLFARERGIEIFQRDRAAWLATDAALAAGLQKTGAQGWITVRADGDWLVRFVAPCAAGVCSVLDVQLKGNRPKARRLKTPAPLSAQEQATWKARELALSVEFKPCSDRYNTVVIPAGGQDGNWVVYLLAATTDPNVVILAGHRRITVSGDGRTVLKNEELSKSCLQVKKEKESAGLMVTHLLDPYPIETHMFTSLNYGVPLYVGTGNGLFVIDGGTITKAQ